MGTLKRKFFFYFVIKFADGNIVNLMMKSKKLIFSSEFSYGNLGLG